MNAATILLFLSVGLANGQLNFEGNPLTENTEYTAEESRFSARTAKQEIAANLTDTPSELSQSLQSTGNSSNPTKTVINDRPLDQEHLSSSATSQDTLQTARYLSSAHNQDGNSVNRAEAALNNFLNSRTPEESRLSLDHYLQSRAAPHSGQTTYVDQQQLTQHPAAPQSVSSTVNRHLTAQLVQQRQSLQAFPVNQPTYNAVANPLDLRANALNPMATPVTLPQQQPAQPYAAGLQAQQQPMQPYAAGLQPQQQPAQPYAAGLQAQQQSMQPYAAGQQPQQQPVQPYATGLQPRNDVYYPGWYQRVRRVRGRPFPYAQSRGGPGFYPGPVPPVPFKQKGPPVEVIYTKPPGFHRGPPPISNSPVPYEDATPWFPEADHPPPSKDVYYSQLYAQSYDPHYYNYIAKTGKIKPHLYGKLGKHHENEGDSIWSELYRGFKKHGLKNMMTPTFLLGMTLPVVTLMLTALVQKRSLSRSDSREFSREDTIQEYLEQVQKAVECYEKRRRKGDANVDEC